MQIAHLPISRPDIRACWITVDDLNSDIAVAVVAWPQQAIALAPDTAASFATSDGGMTWRSLESTQAFAISKLVTQPGITYAYLSAPLAAPFQHDLVASDDNMRDWRPIGQAIVAAGQSVQRFWIMPHTHELLAMARTPGSSTMRLWLTLDSGVHWSQVRSPDAAYFVVQLPVTDHEWSICGAHYAPDENPNATPPVIDRLECTANSGRTWTQRPNVMDSSDKQQSRSPDTRATGSGGATLIALTPSGDMLVDDDLSGSHVLRRLSANDSKWQNIATLSDASDQSISYYYAPNAGVLWALPLTSLSGSVHGAFLTASYP